MPTRFGRTPNRRQTLSEELMMRKMTKEQFLTALENLHRSHFDALKRFCLKIYNTNPKHTLCSTEREEGNSSTKVSQEMMDLAEDTAQEAFAKAIEKYSQYDSTKAKLITWVYTIAENLCYDNMKSKWYEDYTTESTPERDNAISTSFLPVYKRENKTISNSDIAMVDSDLPLNTFPTEKAERIKLLEGMKKKRKLNYLDLTPRQLDILIKLVETNNRSDVAADLGISRNALDKEYSKIKSKIYKRNGQDSGTPSYKYPKAEKYSPEEVRSYLRRSQDVYDAARAKGGIPDYGRIDGGKRGEHLIVKRGGLPYPGQNRDGLDWSEILSPHVASGGMVEEYRSFGNSDRAKHFEDYIFPGRSGKSLRRTAKREAELDEDITQLLEKLIADGTLPER